MSIIQTEHNNLSRDTASKAILVTDDIARLEFKKKQMKSRKELEVVHNEIQQLKDSVADINKLKDELCEIKSMLQTFCSTKG